MTGTPNSANGDEHLRAGEGPGSFRSQLGPLLLLTSIFFVNFISRITLAPLLPRVESDLGLSHVEAGSLFFMISLGYFSTLLASGFIASRLTHRRTIIYSNLAVGLALLFTAFSSGVWGMRLGLIALGMAAGPYIPSGIATLTSIIDSRHWGKAIGIHELAPNLSFVVAPIICEVVLYWFSWRAVFLVLGIGALLLAVIFARFGSGGEFHGQTADYTSYRTILSTRSFWILVILFSLGISSTLGIYTMLPIYLVAEHGMLPGRANTLVALSRVAGVAMTLVGGWATDRFGPRGVLRLVFLLTGATTLFIGFASSLWVEVAVFIQPLLAVCFFPAGLAALAMVSSERQRNILVSLTVPFAFLIGGGGAPTLIGFFGDLGSFGGGIALVGAAITMGVVLTGLLRFQEGR